MTRGWTAAEIIEDELLYAELVSRTHSHYRAETTRRILDRLEQAGYDVKRRAVATVSPGLDTALDEGNRGSRG